VTPFDFEFIAGMVQSHAAIVLQGKEYLVSSRLQPIVEREGLGSITSLVERLRGEPHGPLARSVVEAMTTNETLFFRDPHVFDALRVKIIPELIAARRRERQLVIWSAACSTGQEPYSVIMLLRDHFPELVGWQVTVLATDLSAEALARAKAATYGPIEVARGLPVGCLVRHFVRDGESWRLREDVRRGVDLRRLNLKEDWTLPVAPDLVLLRNVLYYFAPADKKAILARVRRSVRPGGVLLVGSTETIADGEGFAAEESARATLYRPV
jgi:chemotaxis protein methyltransferase CheR